MAKEAKEYLPLTETTFLILCSLKNSLHGYGIMQKVSETTNGRIVLAPGTLYGALSKLTKDNLISTEEGTSLGDKKKNYKLTALGNEVVNLELSRIDKLLNEAKNLYEVI